MSDTKNADQPTCILCGDPMPPGEEMFKFHGYSGPCPKPPLPPKPTVQAKLLAACRIAHDAIARAETPGPHKQRDMQFVLDQLSDAIQAAGNHEVPVPEKPKLCRCGLPLVGDGTDPWCSGCNMSASICDCCPSAPLATCPECGGEVGGHKLHCSVLVRALDALDGAGPRLR